MAAPEKKDGAGFLIAIVGTVLVALAGIIVGHWQLTGTRPPASEIGSYAPGSLQDVPLDASGRTPLPRSTST